MDENELITHLQNPSLYDHPIKHFKVLETHLSWVLLTGLYAYKIKKPVHFSFVDFSTLEKRRFFCEEELRLNKRLSAFLYIGMVAITGSQENPQLNGSGQVIEYALKMEEFNQEQLFSVLASENLLSFPLIDKLAQKIATFHLKTDVLSRDSSYGNLASIKIPMLENFQECKQRTKRQNLLSKLTALQDFSLQQFETLKPYFQTRKVDGFIRDCHGDLHLGNIVLLHHLPIVFDCIEFNAEFRCIDVMNEIAFLTMDLKHKKNTLLATAFLNAYLSLTGDYEGLRLLSFYEIYRAMVRAKVALLTPGAASRKLFADYLKLSERLMQQSRHSAPDLIMTHGLSGSGKTTVSDLLALELNAIHIRSDVERKRLFGTKSLKVLYSPEATKKTYTRLLDLSAQILNSGSTVIVDAAFLQQQQRDPFIQLAKKLNISLIILQFETALPTLHQRVAHRAALGKDASDATKEVLEQQVKEVEPLSPNELPYTVKINTEKKISIAGIVKKIAKVH